MRARTPLALLALLAVAALTVFAPLSQATGSTSATTAAKKKKKKALKCKKGYVKKTVKKKKGKKTVKVKKCVKKKTTKKPVKKPTGTNPAPTTPAPPVKAVTTFAGTTAQGQPITINKRLSGSISVATKVTVNCGLNDDRTYDVLASAVSAGSSFLATDQNAKSDGNSSRTVQVKGTTANTTITGTIETRASGGCPAGPDVSFTANAQ